MRRSYKLQHYPTFQPLSTLSHTPFTSHLFLKLRTQRADKVSECSKLLNTDLDDQQLKLSLGQPRLRTNCCLFWFFVLTLIQDNCSVESSSRLPDPYPTSSDRRREVWPQEWLEEWTLPGTWKIIYNQIVIFLLRKHQFWYHISPWFLLILENLHVFCRFLFFFWISSEVSMSILIPEELSA